MIRVPFSVVIPTLNEAAALPGLLNSLSELRKAGAEIIIADGGSSDGSFASLPQDISVVEAPRGRARQMNAGAAQASGEWLLFLHADTYLPPESVALLGSVAQCAEAQWGFFPLKLSGKAAPLRVIERMINWRSRLTSIATGDQALFIRSELFKTLGGYADIPLMEDVELSRRLKRLARPVIPNRCVLTSSRRWEMHGLVNTVAKMWFLRGAYALGASPRWLVKLYYPNYREPER